ncbi:MAG: DUF1848 family protein [Bacillota bacterium]|nr:DUF1848 family protein [Bacillota bacterium]
MPKIVSVSRRTDIPAFYGDWFLEQVRRGETAVLHPYRREKLLVSLKPEDVAAFVFWSKNYAPFFKHLEELERRGYNFVLFFTITGLPRALEPRVPAPAGTLATFKALSGRYSPERVLWRYDPIVLSNFTPPAGELWSRGTPSLKRRRGSRRFTGSRKNPNNANPDVVLARRGAY